MVYFGNTKTGRKPRHKYNAISGSIEGVTLRFDRVPSGKKRKSQTYEAILDVQEHRLVGTYTDRRGRNPKPWSSKQVSTLSSLNLPRLNYERFPVSGWVPPAADDSSVRVSGKVQEFEISNPDSPCLFKYNLSQPELYGLLRIETEGVECDGGLVHGQGKVSIKRVDGKKHATFSGGFSRGYFTKNKIWDFKVASRQRGPNGENQMTAIVGSDPEARAHFLMVLTEDREIWRACKTPAVIAVTENRELFLDAGQIERLFYTAVEFANLVCPDVLQLQFVASKTPEYPNIRAGQGLYAVNAQKDWKSGAWRFDPNRAKNQVMASHLATLKKQEQERRAVEQQAERERISAERRAAEDLRQRELAERREVQQRAQRVTAISDDFTRLEQADIYDRLAYKYGIKRPHNLAIATAMSQVLGEPVRVNALLRISEVDGNNGTADWPNLVRLIGAAGVIDEEGWYIVSGDLEVPRTRREDGNKDIPVFDIELAIACEEEQCGEVKDTLALVRGKHQFPDWEPPTASVGK